MENIRINSTIKKFGIENEDGEIIAVLELDSSNTNIVDKFGQLYVKIQTISDDLQRELEEAEKEMGDTLTPSDVSKLTAIYGNHVNKVIYGLEDILGEGFIHDVYARNYELDNSFIPDAEVLKDLLSSIMPIIEKVYKKQPTSDKYSPNKKGKRTREEKIAEYKGQINA